MERTLEKDMEPESKSFWIWYFLAGVLISRKEKLHGEFRVVLVAKAMLARSHI